MTASVSPRNYAITQRVLQGESCRHVAQDYAIGQERVNQIAHETIRRLVGFYTWSLDEQLSFPTSLQTWRHRYITGQLVLDEEHSL